MGTHLSAERCPSCAAALPPGAGKCSQCGWFRFVAPLEAPVNAPAAPASASASQTAGVGEAACQQHPDAPAAYTCQRCGAFACKDCLKQTPDAQQQWVCPPCMERLPLGEVPWEQRTELGFWRAWWRTTFGAMIAPHRTFHARPRDPQLAQSAYFVALQSFLAALPTCLLYVGIFLVVALTESGDKDFGERFAPAIVFAVWAVLAPLFTLAAVFVGGSLDHLILRMLGGTGSWAMTIRAASYAQAPMALGVVPLCSLYVWPIWTLVTRFFAYRAAHEASTPVALAGALGTPLLFCGGWSALFAIALAAG